jgi:hypothetical protein
LKGFQGFGKKFCRETAKGKKIKAAWGMKELGV